MRNVIQVINERYAQMKPAERSVAKYVMKQPEEVLLLSMKALAERVDVSDNSVLRFCRTCGFSGYLDFKTALLPQVVTQRGSIYKQVRRTDDVARRAEKILENIQSTIKATYAATQEKHVTEVVARIARSNSVVAVGLAGSAGVAMVFADSLLSMGVRAVAMSDRIEIERLCRCLDAGTAVVGFSTSGETPEVLMAIERARGNGAFTVLVTNNISVKDDVEADVFLFTQVPSQELAGSFFALPRIAQLSLAELILSKLPEYLNRVP